MKFQVLVAATDSAGDLIWAYSHEEVFVGEEDAEANAIRLLAEMTRRVDEGREAIIKQAGVDLPRIDAEQREGL